MALNKMIIGGCLIAAGAGIIGWNETNTASTQDAISEMASSAVELGSVSSVNSSLNGKTVHASGTVSLSEPFIDPDFGVTGNVLSFSRSTQFYLWRERAESQTRKTADGKDEKFTTYSYTRQWGSDYVDSTSFHDVSARSSRANRKLVDKPKTAVVYTDKAMLGAYSVPSSMLKSLGSPKPFTVQLDRDARIRLASLIADKHPGWTRHILGLPLSASTSDVAPDVADKLIHADGNELYFGRDPHRPEIGDVRITYSALPVSDISLIAALNGNTFKPFVSSKGTSLEIVSAGSRSLEEMCASRSQGSRNMSWFMRAVGALAAILGIGMIGRRKKG